MRLKTLHLERYGHFTGKQIDFREGACLHVVHGANEAGKTSSLAAITDLLFRFEPRSEWDFLHPGKLSLGGTILGGDGRTLSFKRRKGTRYTLFDASGGALPEDMLDPYLGSLTRETFSRAFGLSAKGLRKGAKEMLKSGGEVGASLFAAASGLRGLNEMRTRLDTETSAIFTPHRSQNRTFYQALKRFEDAAKEIKQREFRDRDLKERVARVESLAQALESIRERRRVDALRREHLERLREVAPLLHTITRHERTLAEWPDLPVLGERDLTRLRDAWDRAEEAEASLNRLVSGHEQARLYAESFAFEQALLMEAAAVQSLQGQTGAYIEKKGQIGGVRAEGDKTRRELEDMRIQLGLPVEADVSSMQPGDASVVRTRKLLARGRALEQALLAHAQGIRTEAEEVERLGAERRSAGAVSDPAPLRERLERLLPVLDRLPELDRLQQKLAWDGERLSEQARQMSPSIADLDALAATPLPQPLTIQQFAAEMEGLTQAIGTLETRLQQTRAALGEGRAQRERFESAAPVASPEKITAERELRSSAWVPLRSLLLGRGELPGPGLLAGMLLGFETSMADADRLADQAILDAKRVAEYLTNERVIAAHEQVNARLEAELQAATIAEAEAQARWRALWRHTALEPQAPRIMSSWLVEVKRLLELRAELRKDAHEAERLRTEIATVRPALDEILAELSVQGAGGLPDTLALTAVRAELGERRRIWEAAATLLVLETSARERLGQLHGAQQADEQQWKTWQNEWQAVLPLLHLPVDSVFDEAEAVLGLWQGIPGKLETLALNARRVSGMQRDIKAFEEHTFALLARLAEGEQDVDPDAVVKLLVARLGKANEQHAKQEEAERQVKLLASSIVDAKVLAADLRMQFTQLAAGLPSTDDPEAQLDSLKRRAETERELQARRETLESLARNQSEEELRAALERFDEAEATVSINELRRQDELYNAEENSTFADLQNARRELDALQAGVGAEIALQQKKNAEAELLQQVHAWAVKRLSQLLLAQAIETHRSRQEQPLLQRASQLFQMLTAGGFASIEQEGDDGKDDGKVRLVGRRDAEHTVCLSAMSTGTRDQLYLALRLAYLEQYATSTEPVPFIGDDLFTSSDEARTAQGLKALAATGHLFQPILFTHHEHVVELACKELGRGVDVIVLNQ